MDKSPTISLIIAFLVFSIVFIYTKAHPFQAKTINDETYTVQENTNSESFQVLLDEYSTYLEVEDSIKKAIVALPKTIDEDSTSDNDKEGSEKVKYKNTGYVALNKAAAKKTDTIAIFSNKAVLTDSARNEFINKFKRASAGISGSYRVKFKNIVYHLFVADLGKDEIRVHHKITNDDKNFSNIGAVKEYLETENHTPLMITNAGMFTPAFEPEGLFIQNGKILFPLDLGPNRPDANFYLKPNGVFYVDAQNNASIVDTERYLSLHNAGNFQPILATQSGPMLVIDGEMHQAFIPGSNNLNIRSGVGIMQDKKVVFAISTQEINFYDFALFFKDIFNCKNALFLDGAISKMYLRDFSPLELGGEFGPFISVSRIKNNLGLKGKRSKAEPSIRRTNW